MRNGGSICYYFSRYAPDRSPTDPYFGLPRFLTSNCRLIAFWDSTGRTTSFACDCEEIIQISRSIFGFLKSVLSVMRQCSRNRPDAIIACVDEVSIALAWLTSLITGCNFYIVIEDPPFTLRYTHHRTAIKKVERYLRAWFLRRGFSSSTAVFAFVNRGAFAEFLTANTRVFNLRIGSSDEALDRIKSKTILERSSEGSCSFQVGYIGAVNEEQGLLELLDAVAIVKSRLGSIQLCLIGDVDPELNLAQQLMSRNLNSAVSVTGWVTYSEMLDYLSRCDIGCYTRRSSSWAESAYPLKICEYLGLALPVVSWDYPGCQTMLAYGKYGELVPHGEIQLLASSLLKLTDPEVRRSYQMAILSDLDALRGSASYKTLLDEMLPTLVVD